MVVLESMPMLPKGHNAAVVSRRARVLVVDDEPNHLRALDIGLRLEGFVVETAATGDEALRIMARLGHEVDCALVDLMMPGTNGLDLARALRRNHPDTRVVLTSAYHLSERQLARADCGVVGFVPKPYSLSELAEFLRKKLDAPSAGAVPAATAGRDDL